MRQFLTVLLGAELFAMDIHAIREVIAFAALTPVPWMPDFLRGLINVRGTVVPVIDLSVRLGRALTPMTRRSCIVILEPAPQQAPIVLGAMVDAVCAVWPVAQEAIVAPGAFPVPVRADFLEGMISIHELWVPALDTDAVFSVAQLASLMPAHQFSVRQDGNDL